MGQVTNVVKHVGCDVSKVGKGIAKGGAGSGIGKLSRNTLVNLNHGTKASPIVGECRDMA